MNDLETTVRRSLERHAGVPPAGAMPRGTRRAVRLRQSLVVGSTFVVILVLTSGLVGVAGAFRGNEAVPRASVVVPAPSIPGTAPVWDPIEAPAPGAWPAVTHTDFVGAYIDRTVGEDDSIVEGKTPVDAGTVQDVPWSLVALVQNGEGAMWAPAAPGPCVELYVGPAGENGGETVCLRLDTTKERPDLSVGGVVWGMGPLTAYTGVATTRVERLMFEGSDGSERPVRLLSLGGSVHARFFAIFVPNDVRGHLVVYDGSGTVLDRAPLCAASLDVGSREAGGCGPTLLGVSSPVVGEAP
jgi:hypothetical protein